jgi:hypothetical protein
MKKKAAPAARRTEPRTAKAPRPLTSLRNIGSTTARKLELIGVRSAEDFLARDPYEVFYTLRRKVDPTLCRCALAGLVGAKLNAAWHKVTRQSAAEYEKRHPRHKWGPC